MIEVLNASYAVGGVTCALFVLALLFDHDGRCQRMWHYPAAICAGAVWPLVAFGASVLLCFTWRNNR